MPRIAEPLAGAALRLVALRWSVLALHPKSKRPATRHGVRDATRSPAQIRELWTTDGRRNIGVAAGQASGFIVLDLDSDAAVDALSRIAEQHGWLPLTVTCRTPRGRHLYFRYRPGLRNRTHVLGLDIDVRTDGGYVVVPPSSLDSVSEYVWDRSPWDCEIASLPDWLHALLRRDAPRPYRPVAMAYPGAPNRYGARVLRSECEALARVPKGARNNAANAAAFRVARIMDGCGLDEHVVVRCLFEACEANGLVRDDGQRAVLATLASGLRGGRAKARSIAPRGDGA